MMFSGYPANLLQARLDFTSFNAMRLGSPFAYAVGLAILFCRNQGSLQNVVACQVASYVVALALAYGLLFAKVRIRFAWEPRASRSLLTFGLKTQFGNVSDYVNRSADQLLLSLFVAPRELGLYAVAVSLVSAVLFFPQAAAVVTLAAGASEQGGEASRVIARLFRTTLVWLILACSALFLAAPRLILVVFGPAFVRSALACRILLPGMVAMGLNQVLYDGARALGQPILPSYAQGFAAMVTLLGLFATLPRFGFIGAAMVSTVAYAATLALMLTFCRSRLHIGLADLLGLRGWRGRTIAVAGRSSEEA
jgi:O-antigen/teichoic acid export membrane protein